MSARSRRVVPRAIAKAWLLLCSMLAIVAFVACSSDGDEDGSADALTQSNEPSLYRPGNRFAGWGGAHDRYLDDVQPILGKRCVTCHGCSQAPCQLKLTGYEGVVRGATKTNLFAVQALPISTGPTRMKDGVTEADWRRKGFFSVTAGGRDSIMYRLLEHGAASNAPGFDLAPARAIWDRHAEQLLFTCVETKQELESRIARPGTGMPFGFTALAAEEEETLAKWLEDGAPGPSAEAQAVLAAPRDAAAVQAWEDFFNQETPKAKLTARYIYEHVFFAKLHLDQSQAGKGDFFELVRATSRTGPVEEIVTVRPVDDPGRPFFYRFKKHTHLITAKDFVVLHLTDALRAHWTDLFLKSRWDVNAPPDYSTDNPFKYFDPMPGTIRSQFMMENGRLLKEAMVKGDVCTGTQATYAIRDRYLTMFLKPESDPSAIDPKLGQKTWFHLDPNSGSTVRDADFDHLFEKALRKLKPEGLSIEDLWDGGKQDKNAMITVFRHGTNASAHFGPMGQLPETMWVFSYANYERHYYNLVALYQPWAAMPHKLHSWSTTSHVRAAAEDTFLLFFPEAMRDRLRKQFTPGWAGYTDLAEIALAGTGYPSATPDIDPAHPLEDFVSRVRKYFGEAIAGTDTLNPDPLAAVAAAASPSPNSGDVEATLLALSEPRGDIPDTLPEVTWVSVEGGGAPRVYTLITNRVYWSNSRLISTFFPSINRRPELDSFSVVRGRIGTLPNLFLRVPAAELASFVQGARGPAEERVRTFAKYQVRRNTTDFWSFLDAAHAGALAENPLESGLFDTSAYVWPL